MRTYAKNIIDYARHIGCVEDGYFDAEKITPPYNSRFPEIPSDEEITELIGNDTGFYIRYDKLLEFLKSSSYTLVWTSLCEKRILTPSFGRWDLPPKAIHMSSVYYLKDGKIAKASETLFEDRLYY